MQSSASSFILDASAFYAGLPLSGSKYYTTEQVFDEVKHLGKSFSAIETILEAGNLEIFEPKARFMEKARKMASQSGDISKMSEADVSVIALALQLADHNPVVVTDDFAVANVAERENIRVSYVLSRGIRKVGRWIRYCPACSKVYDASKKKCDLCGNLLRAKLKSRA